MSLASFNRWKASATHLAISAAIGAVVVALMLVLWYPPPYFEAMGGQTLILILVGVDVVLGPLITLIIFDPRKKSLRFDLAMIALVQLSALIYGCHVMFVARPVYAVFVVDRFEAIAANQVDEASLAKALPEFRSLPLAGPQVIAARAPEDEQRKLALVVSASRGGPDVANFADLYVPYAQLQQGAAAKARPLAHLVNRQPDAMTAIRAFVADAGRPEDALGFLPLRARSRDMAAIVETKTGEFIGVLALNPW
jgi:hypothetical protein